MLKNGLCHATRHVTTVTSTWFAHARVTIICLACRKTTTQTSSSASTAARCGKSVRTHLTVKRTQTMAKIETNADEWTDEQIRVVIAVASVADGGCKTCTAECLGVLKEIMGANAHERIDSIEKKFFDDYKYGYYT